MSKFACVCGESITISGSIPNPNEWLAISDVHFEGFFDDGDAEAVYRAFTHAFVCPRSGHVWVFRDGFDEPPVGYAPL